MGLSMSYEEEEHVIKSPMRKQKNLIVEVTNMEEN